MIYFVPKKIIYSVGPDSLFFSIFFCLSIRITSISSAFDASKNTFYTETMFRGLPPCSDPLLECQYFVNITTHFIGRGAI